MLDILPVEVLQQLILPRLLAPDKLQWTCHSIQWLASFACTCKAAREAVSWFWRSSADLLDGPVPLPLAAVPTHSTLTCWDDLRTPGNMDSMSKLELFAAARSCPVLTHITINSSKEELEQVLQACLPPPGCPLTVVQYWRMVVLPKGMIISRHQAKELYLLTNGELTLVCPNRDWIPEHFVVSASALKHKYSVCALEAGLAIRQDRRTRLKARKERQKEDRRQQLLQALSAKGLELRRDSKLCQMYIQDGKVDFEAVVNTVAEMAFLHQHTDYRQCIREVREELLEQQLGYSTATLSAMAKERALKRWALQQNGRNDSGAVP
eukprot:jgi/Chrzof1/7997/UNPLg00048.t1